MLNLDLWIIALKALPHRCFCDLSRKGHLRMPSVAGVWNPSFHPRRSAQGYLPTSLPACARQVPCASLSLPWCFLLVPAHRYAHLYNSWSWRKRAKRQLAAEPLCALCLARKALTPATIADHLHPHRGNRDSFLLGELQSLCKACHDGRKQQTELHGYQLDLGADGWPVDPAHPANQPRPGPRIDTPTRTDHRRYGGRGRHGGTARPAPWNL